MGCSFCSKNNIIIKNELSFSPFNYIKLKGANPESFNFISEFINDNNLRNFQINEINISPLILRFLYRNKIGSSKIIYQLNKLSSNIKGYLFRQKYEDYLKTQLMDITNELYFQFIILTKNLLSTRILNNKEDEKLKNIMKTEWKEFYDKDPTITIKNQINETRKYNNGLIFKYKNTFTENKNIEQCLKNVESCYKGSVEFITNKKCGFGELININGMQEIGTFYNDEFCGWNVHINNNGIIYIGLFNNDLLNGSGLYFDINNEYIYRGLFKDFQKDGFGTEYFRGDKYKGEFKEDKKSGKGEIIFKNNDIYKGEFSNDKINGFGNYIWKNKNREYSGNFIDGKMNGKGMLKWGDNMYYKGIFNNGIKEGKGEFGYLNKIKYFFNFKNNLPIDKGYYINNNNNKSIVYYYQGKIIDNNRNETTFFFD